MQPSASLSGQIIISLSVKVKVVLVALNFPGELMFLLRGYIIWGLYSVVRRGVKVFAGIPVDASKVIMKVIGLIKVIPVIFYFRNSAIVFSPYYNYLYQHIIPFQIKDWNIIAFMAHHHIKPRVGLEVIRTENKNEMAHFFSLNIKNQKTIQGG